ncbi:hypothetical protein L1987_76763 [Smallanthus sonchifolius]|uniref:Uncharacterized protein n=1 Tax=Smallanthus sonchifolius TaxID=185202 RepID=A0ACB8Z8K0_9ASTR|nr:hypothetical protein L1987_76763 [Smallanthus sonchifolius]
MSDNSTSSTPPTTQSLHPVYTVTNIQHKVRVLDGVKVSYPSWVKLFMLHATGYDVVHHIDGTPAPDKDDADYSSWKKIDAVVLQWIYDTLSDELLVRVLEDTSTAYEAWERVKKLFLNNKGSRAHALQHELTNLTLSAMPDLDSYCQRIRELADQLAAVDCPLTNTQRILHLVRGLPREYDTTAAILNQSLPPWETAVDQLQSEARRIAAREHTPSTPLVAAAISSQPGREPSHRNSTPPPTNNYRNPQSYTRRYNNSHDHQPRRDSNRTSRNNNRNPSQYSPRPYSPQPMPYTPYWAPHPQQAYPFWAPPPCPYPTQPWPQNWDSRPKTRSSRNSGPTQPQSAQAHLTETDPLEPTQLADAVQAFTLEHGEQGDDQWHFDTGFQGWHDPEPPQQYQ